MEEDCLIGLEGENRLGGLELDLREKLGWVI